MQRQHYNCVSYARPDGHPKRQKRRMNGAGWFFVSTEFFLFCAWIPSRILRDYENTFSASMNLLDASGPPIISARGLYDTTLLLTPIAC